MDITFNQSGLSKISCSFREKLAKLYVGAPVGTWRPLLREILDPPLEFFTNFQEMPQLAFKDTFWNSII